MFSRPRPSIQPSLATIVTSGPISGLMLTAALVCMSVTATAQAPLGLGAAKSEAKKDPSTSEETRFAPGVMQVIPPAPEPEETFAGPQTLQSLLDAHPEIQFGGETHPDGSPHFDPRSRTLVEMAKQVILRREIYAFEFAFKPLRHVYIDVPRADGRMQRKLIWYMVYRVRYRGGDLRPSADIIAGVPIYKRVEEVHYNNRRFFPMLVLRNQSTGTAYVDRVLPSAADKIKVREQITAPLYNSVEITRVKVPYSGDAAAGGIWGVATWEDVDPDIDFLSVEVSGLTNAFEQDGEGMDAPYRRKVLQLNFYRPGDKVAQTDDRIRFGVPAYENKAEQDYILEQYGLDERLDYRWLFR
ncbi:hypothetical protein LF1_41820 [Rubripirellula obstinata]|uniref:Uncharacterized protein n=1 Tax=Rubripirellula obstinata TaxID=406547 RepID=A0A5B1CK95_9BACT|nr:hypothetical protein [Rubripirellula obstinata]KAA1261627.1 hypothetical protein LF1_41820 [Rubripirellula obstinata]